MKFFCIKKHFDQNAKLWSPGEILEARDGDLSFTKEYFASSLPHHLTAKDEPEKRAYSAMIQEKPADFVTAMKAIKNMDIEAVKSDLEEPEPVVLEPVEANAKKAVKRGK